MKLLRLSLIVVLVISFSACVTTRAQLNEKSAQDDLPNSPDVAKSAAVKSEELSPTQSPPTTPTVVSSPAVVASPVQKSVSAVPQGEYGLEEMRAELAKLAGRVEDLEQEKKVKEAAQIEEQAKLQAKIDDLQKQLKDKETQQNTGPSLPEGKTPFEAGKDAFFAARYDIAIQFFDQFLKANEQGKDVEEATFLRAESNFNLKEYKKAIVDYSKFPEKYSKSNFHPKALLKIAESFEALEMKEDAMAFYSDLVDKFPKTVEGKIAKKKLNGKTKKK